MKSFCSATQYRKLAGITYSIISCIFYVANNFLFKYACNTRLYYPFDVLFIRGIVSGTLSKASMYASHHSEYALTNNEFRFIYVRVVLLSFVSLAFSLGVLYIPISLATVVYYTSPIITIFMASYMVNEKTHIYDIIAAFLSFLGLIIIVKPPFMFGKQEQHSLSFFIAILAFIMCSIINAYTNIMCRKIKSKISFFIITYYYGQVMAIILGIILFIRQRNIELKADFTLNDAIFCIGIAVVQFAGSFFQYISFKYEEAGRLGIVTYIQVLFTYIVEIVLFKMVPDRYTILGAGLIVFSSIAVIAHKMMNDKRHNSIASEEGSEIEDKLNN